MEDLFGKRDPAFDERETRKILDDVKKANVSLGIFTFCFGAILVLVLAGTGFVLFTDKAVELRCRMVANGSEICATLKTPTAGQDVVEIEASEADSDTESTARFTALVSKDVLPGESNLSKPVSLYGATDRQGTSEIFTTLLDFRGKDAFANWKIPENGLPLTVDYMDENGTVIVYNVLVYVKTQTTSYADWPVGMTKNQVNELPDGGRFRKKKSISSS